MGKGQQTVVAQPKSEFTSILRGDEAIRYIARAVIGVSFFAAMYSGFVADSAPIESVQWMKGIAVMLTWGIVMMSGAVVDIRAEDGAYALPNKRE
jgi:hypothetical protein